MYVVIRQADTGEADTLAVFAPEREDEADELARLANARDGAAYHSWVEYTPLEINAQHAFRVLFGE